MIFNLTEAIPTMPTHNYNCLVRNGITTYEKLADMTDYDLAMLKNVHDIKGLICMRDKAKYYRDFKEKQKSEYEKALSECGKE